MTTDLDDAQRFLPVEGLHNLRDFGGLPGTAGPLVAGRFWRGDSPHLLGAAGIARLRALGLGTVIDLRRDFELEQAPNPFAAGGEVAFHHVSLFDGLDLSDPTLTDHEDPLAALYLALLDSGAATFVQIMRTILDAPAGAVMFHCTLGKDRTGLLAALLQQLAGTPDADILRDYALTGPRIGPVLARLGDEIRARGGDPERARLYWSSAPATMAAALHSLHQGFGGAAHYLGAAGLAPDELAGLRARLSDPHHTLLPSQTHPEIA